MRDPLSSMCAADVMRAVESRRHELEVTPEELARLSGVSRRTMNACLSGHTEISLLLRIATALQLRLQLAPEPGREQFATLPIFLEETTEALQQD
jgi:DNA-binding XRE family transcriptional regulator